MHEIKIKNPLMAGIFLSLLLFNSASVWAETTEELVHLGNVSGKQAKYRDAIRYYTKAIESNHNYANAYYNRGYVYVEIRKYKLAIKDLTAALQINPDYAPAYHVRGIAYFEKKKYHEAVADYSNAIDLDPKNVRYYISRMSAYCKLGYSDKAWEDVIHIQKLGGTVSPTTINILKNKSYRE